MSDQPKPPPEPIVYEDTVTILDEDGNVVPRMVYSSIPGRAPYLDPGLERRREAAEALRPGDAEGSASEG